ncbi:MAG TPA: transglutaminase domain-containing protein, partial [Polyangiaceae bacterium]
MHVQPSPSRPLSARLLGSRAPFVALLLLASATAFAATATPPAPVAGSGASAASRGRWTDENPDAMIDRAVERAITDRDAIASLTTIDALADRGTQGRARQAMTAVGSIAGLSDDVKAEAQLLARSVAPDEGTAPGIDADRQLGVVTDLAILGPFRDTGGGLAAKDGPEAKGATFADRAARYSWGTVDVAWRTVPRAFASARGVPLDLLVHPRRESCSWVATSLSLTADAPVRVRVAATGQVRLMFDGIELGRSEDVDSSAHFDRLAYRVEASMGPHVLAAKVCTGALDDDGRVRLILTDDFGAALPRAPSADLTPRKATGAKPKAVKALAVPLARTLALPPGTPTTDAQLDAAVVRTLGGADDLRSPRAPGLLDAIARRSDATEDVLAMAGWIAPSGANRSGWLNDARTRAQAAHDARTETFVARRLVAEHLNASMPDWAMATWRAASPAKDPEALLLGAMVEEALGTDALRAQALRELGGAFRADRGKLPTNAVLRLASLASAFDPALAREAREEMATRGDRGASWVQAEATRGAKEAAQAAQTAFDTAGVDDVDAALGVARAVSQAGSHAVARKLYATLVQWAPNRPEAWAGLADEIAAAPDSQSGAAIEAALRRARELSPGEARYREELALRSPSTAPEAMTRGDEHYLVPSQTILARRKGVPAGQPDVSERQLYSLRAVVIHPDHRVSMLKQYAREIVVAPRTQGELYEDLPIEADLVEILRARVHRKDGGTAFPTEEHNEGTRPRIRWPDLQPGDVVEVAMRDWTRGPVGGRADAPFYFRDVAGGLATNPLLYNEVDVETLPDAPLYLDVINGGDYQRTEKDEAGHHVVRFVWEHPPTVADEPLAPSQSEVLPMVLGSTFKSWDTFRAWYAEAVHGFTEPDEEVRRLATELTKGKTTREDKLRALFDFVSDDIRYVNYTSGEWWLPNRPQQLLARREGDCDDKAMLLITLLRAVGIDAQEVMVQTRLTGQPSLLLAKNVAVPLFDHGIAFLPGPNGGTYLDATSPQSRLGPLPSMDAKAVALRMDSGPAEIVHLPPSSPEDHGSDVKWTITLRADGSGELVGEERHMGDQAFWLRTSLSQADSRMNYVESALLGRWFPTVVVDKNVDFKGDLPHGQAWVRYQAKSDGLARHEGGELVVPVSPSATLASQIAPLV